MMRALPALVLAVTAAFLVWKAAPPPTGTGAGPHGLASLSVPPGFEVSLASRPGLVRYPMLGTIAPDGAMYLCESSGKTMQTPEMSADPNYVVTRLTDSDGDGVYDHGTVFASRLTLPAGAAFLDGSLYVAAPPQLWRFQDTDGDGVADGKEIVVEGWNLSANAASLHGPILGPDGWLYLTDGRHGFDIQTKDGRRFQGKASRIWRLRPDGTGLEWFAGGGFDNPVEVAFTDGGDVFGTMTYFQDPAEGQRDAILHFVEGGVYPKPYPVTEEFKRTGDLMPVMTKFARVAPSGLLRYRGMALGPEYAGDLFSAHFNAHRVLRHRVLRAGATYRTEDSDFLVAADPDIHPTDVMQDRDGSLIVVDTGAWFIHGCPLSRAAKPDVHGALYRVRRQGAPPARPDLNHALAERDPAVLARLLDDPNPALADEAGHRLVAFGPPAVPALAEQRAAARTAAGASAAVFALYRIGTPEARAAVRESLRDPRWEVRQAAARGAGMAQDRDALPMLLELVAEEDPAVRRQAATALGQIGDPRAAPALVRAAANPEDRFVEHALIYALIQLRQAPPLLAALSPSSPAGARKAALVALDQMDGSPLREAHLLPFLSDGDPELRRTALWIASRHPRWSGRLATALVARLQSGAFDAREAEMTGQAMAAFCAEPALQRAAGGLLGDPSLPAGRQLFLLETAERCAAREFPASWSAGLRRALSHPEAGVRVRALALIRNRGLAGFDQPLGELVHDARQPDEVRIAALSTLGGRSPRLSDAGFVYLAGRLLPAVEASTKLAAAQVLGRARLTEAQAAAVAEKYLAAADPLVLPNLLDALRGQTSPATGSALVAALVRVEAALGTVGMQRVRQVLDNFPAPVQQSARPLLARLERERRERLKKLDRLRTALHGGNPDRGREIFFGAKAGCSGCHTIGVEGGQVGPDLTSIGAIRAPHDLLEAIVLPSESFVPGHEVYRVETEREWYAGVLGASTPEAVRLITGPGDEVRIPRKEIKSMGYAQVSLMPEGYDEVLSALELKDLIAFLRAQTARPATAGAGSP